MKKPVIYHVSMTDGHDYRIEMDPDRMSPFGAMERGLPFKTRGYRMDEAAAEIHPVTLVLNSRQIVVLAEVAA